MLALRSSFILALLILALLPTSAGGVGALQPVKLEAASARFEPQSPGGWLAASPMTLTVQFKSPVVSASWHWLGPDERPVQWNGAPLPSAEMRPLPGGANTWTGRAAAPPLAGTYKVRVVARPSGGQVGTALPEQSLLLSQSATVRADEQPFSRGFAFVRDRNIWLRSLDLNRDRAATFYGYPALASMPAWSPDGRWLAYILDPGTGEGNELWVARPDGTSPRRVARSSADRPFGDPLYTAAGVLLVGTSRPLRSGGVQIGDTLDLHQVDLASGKLALLQPGVSMPASAPNAERLTFIRDTPSSDGELEQSLVVSDLDGRNEQTLIAAGVMDGLYGPVWSPDGRKIAFLSRGLAPPDGGGLALHAMHGGVWDLWVVPAERGAPLFVSGIQEDLPRMQWPPGNSVYFISPSGFWSAPATGGPPQLLLPNDSHSELSVFAPQPRSAPPISGPSKCFAETGYCLRGIFLQYWEAKGGLAQFGFPITPELVEEGRTVQYVQRARLEWHTEHKGTPYEVLAGRLGADLADTRAALGERPFQRVARPSGGSSLYFPETGHTLSAPLRAYWESKGGLPVFGYPLSEPFQERSPTDGKTYLVQYFERNRLEHHPEYAGTPNEVLLGLLGVQEYSRRYR